MKKEKLEYLIAKCDLKIVHLKKDKENAKEKVESDIIEILSGYLSDKKNKEKMRENILKKDHEYLIELYKTSCNNAISRLEKLRDNFQLYLKYL